MCAAHRTCRVRTCVTPARDAVREAGDVTGAMVDVQAQSTDLEQALKNILKKQKANVEIKIESKRNWK